MIGKHFYNKHDNIGGTIVEEVKGEHRFAGEIVMWYRIRIFGSSETILVSTNNFWDDWREIKFNNMGLG